MSATSPTAVTPVHYPALLDPKQHPDWDRRRVHPPTWETFGHRTQFTTLRSLTQSEWREDLERYTETFHLGRVIWPMAQFLWSPQVGEVIEEIRRRGLFLFDLWSHVPGSPMYGVWSHIVPPPGMVERLREVLGDRFLGIDNGEQDGRYVGGYAPQQCPNGRDGVEQYFNFQRHFQRMGDDLGNHLSTLVSLSFGHYFLKEGNHVLIGAETAQALPNSQVYYAFIRGAGKEYGVPWFGNASVFNRWGWKSYEAGGDGEGTEANCGPKQGASLSLLKRLLFTHYLYNCVAVGFESGWLRPVRGDRPGPVVVGGHRETSGVAEYELTPIGTIQAKANEFVERHGQPGVMHAPVALLLDFFTGWSPPRHLYSNKVFQRWGGLPWGPGDYLTHGVLGQLYPGYEDSSYYHDERGFLSPTPYGDMADCLLNDAPPWVLSQYGLIIVAGELRSGAEGRDRLRDFVAGGGRLVVTAANAAGLIPGLELAPETIVIPAGAEVAWDEGPATREPYPFALHPCVPPQGAEIVATVAGHPAAVRVPYGQGAFVLLLSPFGLNEEALFTGEPRTGVDQPLPSPYLLLDHVARVFDAELSAQQVLAVGEGLGWITCRRGPGDYTVGVYNNGLQARPLAIRPVHGGPVEIRELELDRGEEEAVGYWPEGRENPDAGKNDASSIAGGAMRLFHVELGRDPVRCLPEVQPPEPPRGRWLSLRTEGSVQEEIMRRPTFFQHFDGVKVDWTWLLARDPRQLDRERGWLERQGVRVAVDFSSGLNQYPTLTLIDAYPPRYQTTVEQMDEVLAKLLRLGGQDAVIGLHRGPENHLGPEQTRESFLTAMRSLCTRPANQAVRFHLQHHPWKGPQGNWRAADALAFIREVGVDNLRLALSLGHWAMVPDPEPLEKIVGIVTAAGATLGLVLLAAPDFDRFGQVYDAHLPLHRRPVELTPLAAARSVPWVLDAWYQDHDEEYLDCRLVWP